MTTKKVTLEISIAQYEYLTHMGRIIGAQGIHETIMFLINQDVRETLGKAIVADIDPRVRQSAINVVHPKHKVWHDEPAIDWEYNDDTSRMHVGY